MAGKRAEQLLALMFFVELYTLDRAWLLVAMDLEISQVVTVDGPTVVSRPGDSADTTIVGTGAELTALLLGRSPAGFAPGDFSRALPGP
ncbi:MAG: hypothetical protein JJE52_11965 [Acidimicrobiia bacterium]|nr:hypothetical protein [Acidimicrobiia bacterium]